MEVFAMDRDFFLVKLGNDQDYFKALSDGPWVIFDHYLVVQQWTPAFRVTDKLPNTMVVWVQFPGFPVHFYHKDLLFSLGNLIGRAIKLDFHTLHQQRTRFARVAVEVDLSQPLIPRIRLDGKWQRVEFENIPIVCFECGKIGHTKISCPELYPEQASNRAVDFAPSPATVSVGSSSEEVSGFGPWMLVSRKSRRNQREFPRQGRPEQAEGISEGIINKQERKEADVRKENGRPPNQAGIKSPQRKQSPQATHGGSLNKKGKGENKKGKEVVLADMEGEMASGILGPVPRMESPRKKGAASSRGNVASSSGPKEDGPNTPSQVGLVNLSSKGEKGTKIVIVEAQPYDPPPTRIIDPAVPSAVLRTKQRKEKRKGDQGKREMTPRKSTLVRHSPMKPLKLWSPVKDRKNRGHDKRVSLTLQQIKEWTESSQEVGDVEASREPAPSAAGVGLISSDGNGPPA
ncbi:unnamed protein product [Linum tenue]|uniref:CCHC-type domain-containing protein n=1 Tax=Linum tenue TaxID=586396 RepID=A0AAV0KGH9_9ROSI|nr:unnamed protein product [Linum tenue]